MMLVPLKPQNFMAFFTVRIYMLRVVLIVHKKKKKIERYISTSNRNTPLKERLAASLLQRPHRNPCRPQFKPSLHLWLPPRKHFHGKPMSKARRGTGRRNKKIRKKDESRGQALW